MAWAAPVVLLVVVLVVLVGWRVRRRFLLVTVEGRSMEPAHRHGDQVLVDRRRSATLRIGDVVVVERADRVQQRMIKRVAALPGDRVPIEVCAFQHWPEPTWVPPGHLVLLGDNPSGSLDSRQRGFFPADRLLGVVVRRVRRR
ncbi:signal peptidase I [Plantactinospora sp. GCM10030261]|uniref:signal peptidase I n=1 Tax=Plantactinospora sp. GCM10030261 TaxID=3273420 RepID=UPI00360BB4CE